VFCCRLLEQTGNSELIPSSLFPCFLALDHLLLRFKLPFGLRRFVVGSKVDLAATISICQGIGSTAYCIRGIQKENEGKRRTKEKGEEEGEGEEDGKGTENSFVSYHEMVSEERRIVIDL